MISCKICGHTNEYSIAEHLKYSHEVSTEEYKNEYNAEVWSEERKKMVSEQIKKRWSDPDMREKMEKAIKEGHEDPEYRERMSKKMKKKYDNNEIEPWSKGLTKEEDERLAKIAKINRKKQKGRKNPEHSKRMEEWWENLKENHPERYEEECKKRSRTMAERVANGEHTFNSEYKNGWYESQSGEEFYYFSSYELESMKFFDDCSMVKNWTNKHGIKLLYERSGGKEHYYIPDFYIEIENGISAVIETKGKPDENLEEKKEVANSEFDNYFVCWSVNQVKQSVYELYES